jgi:hypothetical protein
MGFSLFGKKDSELDSYFANRNADFRKELMAGTMSPEDVLAKTSMDSTLRDSLSGGVSGGWLSNPDKMAGVTGLASTLLQAASLPVLLKNAKLQNQALQFNLDTARDEQARRNRNISSFNAL